MPLGAAQARMSDRAGCVWKEEGRCASINCGAIFEVLERLDAAEKPQHMQCLALELVEALEACPPLAKRKTLSCVNTPWLWSCRDTWATWTAKREHEVLATSCCCSRSHDKFQLVWSISSSDPSADHDDGHLDTGGLTPADMVQGVLHVHKQHFEDNCPAHLGKARMARTRTRQRRRSLICAHAIGKPSREQICSDSSASEVAAFAVRTERVSPLEAEPPGFAGARMERREGTTQQKRRGRRRGGDSQNPEKGYQTRSDSLRHWGVFDSSRELLERSRHLMSSAQFTSATEFVGSKVAGSSFACVVLNALLPWSQHLVPSSSCRGKERKRRFNRRGRERECMGSLNARARDLVVVVVRRCKSMPRRSHSTTVTGSPARIPHGNSKEAEGGGMAPLAGQSRAACEQ
ncbi:hypothetical protein K438DRAFT_1767542 [Mycena galopus ATCC 62051]|nr:hypothetical protein K438DRAFT_1767542 [Mycena galopus ATCC 62051]